MDRWMDGCTNRWMDGWVMGEWVDGFMLYHMWYGLYVFTDEIKKFLDDQEYLDN